MGKMSSFGDLRLSKIATWLAPALLLSSCGGSDSAPHPPPVNAAPNFTSASTVTAQENQTAPFYNAVAVDPEGTPVTYAINGGTDAAKFTIDPMTGALSFRAAPDFEAPGDADKDNVYLLQITASDGTLTSSALLLSVTVSDDRSGALRARQVGTGFVDALQLNPVGDGTGRLFVVERGGLIKILNPATGTTATSSFLDITTQVLTTGDRGLRGFALAPDFTTSGIFYVALNNIANQLEVRRYTTMATNHDRAEPASGTIIIRLQGIPNGTASGWIGFGTDGMLLIANPFGGSDPLSGKLLRIDPSADAFPADVDRNYSIPADNPSPTGSAPEVWITNLVDVHGGSVDPVTGTLWIADRPNRGTAYYRITPSDGGKTATPGSFCAATDAMLPQPPGTLRWRRDYTLCASPLGDSGAVGGLVYRGSLEALQGNYFFGFNFGSTGIASFNLAAMTVVGYPELSPAGDSVSGWGQDESRNLYFVNSAGNVYIIEAA